MNSKIIGLDIGGANTKLASSDGKTVELHYLPLWKNTQFPEVLKEIAQRLQPEKVAVVMTGELADCFANKFMKELAFILLFDSDSFLVARAKLS